MVLDMAKPMNKENTIWPGMRGRDAVRKSTPTVDILHVFTIDSSEIQFYRESQLAIGWTESKCKEWDELAKEDHAYHLSTEEFKRYQGPRYLTLKKSGKNGPMRLRPDFRAAVSLKNRLHYESGEQVEEPIFPDQYRIWSPSSSTSWWDKSEWNSKRAHKNFLSDLLSVTVGFVYSRWRSTVADGVCRQIHTRHFSHALGTIHFMYLTLHGSSVCVRASFHLHVIHDVCLIVRWLFLRYVLLRVSFRCLPLLFHTLPVLCLALHFQCRHRRGLKPLHFRRMRSIVPWRYTILSPKWTEVSKVQRPGCTPR